MKYSVILCLLSVKALKVKEVDTAALTADPDVKVADGSDSGTAEAESSSVVTGEGNGTALGVTGGATSEVPNDASCADPVGTLVIKSAKDAAATRLAEKKAAKAEKKKREAEAA